MLRTADLHEIQQDLVRQMAGGVVVIPAGMDVLQLPGTGNACEIFQEQSPEEIMKTAAILG